MIEIQALSGERVRLEPLSHAAIPGLVAAASGPRDTYDYALVPPDLEGMTAYVDQALEEQRDGESVPLVIVDRRNGEIVGSTRYMDVVYWGRTVVFPARWRSAARGSPPRHSGPGSTPR